MRKYNAPRVKESRGVQLLTTIWIVPFIAMIIALWLGYQYYIKIGSAIEITFKSNAGLVENQSPIKMRDVTVGIVKHISLSSDGEGVVIKARMNREVSEYLNNKAKFWIVHPDVGSHGISGLDTIVSGSYIELYGKKESETMHYYVGLEKPHIDDEAKGTYYILSAPKSYNISEGSNIYYRMIKVGRVERVGISPDGSHVNFTIFIEAQYTKFVNYKSKFYTRSAFNLDFSRARLDVSIAPFSQLVHGGISIFTPNNSLDGNSSIKKGTIFPLYKNLAEMKAKQLGIGGEDRVYRLSFKEDTTKLKVGSPVEFKGFQVGYITQIEDKYNKKGIKSNIYATLHMEAFQTKEMNSTEKERMIINLVREGLRAKLSSSMPVVGSQFIELIFDKSHRDTIRIANNGDEIFPTIENHKEEGSIMNQVDRLLAKLQNLPLEPLLNSANSILVQNKKPINSLLKDLDKTILTFNKTIANFNNTVDNLNSFTSNQELHSLPENINNSLRELEFSLQTLQQMSIDYSGDSKFSDQLSVTLKAVTEAAKSFDKTNKMLDRKANALVIGDE